MPNAANATAAPVASMKVQPEADMDDQPLYVNAKQYHRILKRRQQRAKLESQGKIPKERRVSARNVIIACQLFQRCLYTVDVAKMSCHLFVCVFFYF